jgi:hypothetical protein
VEDGVVPFERSNKERESRGKAVREGHFQKLCWHIKDLISQSIQTRERERERRTTPFELQPTVLTSNQVK